MDGIEIGKKYIDGMGEVWEITGIGSKWITFCYWKAKNKEGEERTFSETGEYSPCKYSRRLIAEVKNWKGEKL